jgi:phage repressor protein C with HTH and peptisase S24 domain
MIVLEMNWKSFLENLLNEFRISVPDLEKIAGISNVTFYKIISGETLKPYPSTIKKIENALGIRIDDSDPENITYSRVQNNVVAEFGNEYRVQTETNKKWPMVLGFVPASANAGVSTYYEESIEEKSLDFDPMEYFWLRIDLKNGESMLPTIKPGDYVLVSRNEKVRDGDLVFAIFLDEPGDRGAVKQFSVAAFDPGIGIFSSYNQSHTAIVKKIANCRIYKVKLIEKR